MLNRDGGLLTFFPQKGGGGGLLEGGGLFERGGLNRGFTVLKIQGRSDHLWQCIIIIIIISIFIVIIIFIITVIITIIKNKLTKK